MRRIVNSSKLGGNVNIQLQKAPVMIGPIVHMAKPVKEPSFWETDIQVIKSCGAVGESVKVFVHTKAKQKINILMNRFKKIEWLAYLVGNKETNEVTDLVIPEQRVTAVNVFVDGTVDVPIIGVIHSHHDMGNNFSHTDNEYINQNHDISLCVSNSGINGNVRVKTECGRFAIVKAQVHDVIEGFNADEFLKDIDSLIKPHVVEVGKVNGSKVLNNGVDDIDIESLSRTFRSTERCVIEETKSYENSVRGIELDEFYREEIRVLNSIIEAAVSDDSDRLDMLLSTTSNNVMLTDDFYRLVDEIEVWSDDLTEKEIVALKGLSTRLEKRLDVQ